MNEVGERLDQLLAQPGLQRSQGTEQLDDLDEDPVVGGGCHELEKQWRQRQVVFRVAACQLADDINSRRLYPWVWVLQLLLKPGKGRTQRLWVLEEYFVHDQHCLLPDVRLRVRHQGHDVICQVSGKIWGDKTGQTSQCHSSVVLAGAAQVLSDLVGGQHDDVGTFMEALGGRKVANTLECELGGTHDFNDVEGSPADVVPKHL